MVLLGHFIATTITIRSKVAAKHLWFDVLWVLLALKSFLSGQLDSTPLACRPRADAI